MIGGVRHDDACFTPSLGRDVDHLACSVPNRPGKRLVPSNELPYRTMQLWGWSVSQRSVLSTAGTIGIMGLGFGARANSCQQ